MSAELAVQKPRFLKPIKIDSWKEYFVKLTSAIINGALGKWDSVLLDCLDALKLFGFETTEEELAWKLISRAMMRAISDLVNENSSTLKVDPSKKDIQKLLKLMKWDRELTIGLDFFDNPRQSSAINDVQSFLLEWFLYCGLADKYEANAIVRQLPSFFVFTLNDEWRERKATYQPLRDYFDTPFMKAVVLEEDWSRYQADLRKQAERSAFGECYGLSQLYVPLNAAYAPKTKGSPEPAMSGIRAELRREQDAKDERQIAVDLQKHLMAWLDKEDPYDSVRIISGGPGSGKSSFARIFASELPNSQKVLFIPLHQIDLGTDVEAAVGKFMQDDFHENPLSNADNLLIIFDGLDELTQVNKAYSETARQFVDKVDLQIIRQNRNKRCVRVLYTGRVVVVQSVQSMFKKEQVLNLLPFCMPEEEQKNYIDTNHLLGTDLRDEWWRQYGTLIGYDYKGIPDAFREGKLVDITSQPLLNYLVALSHGKKDLDASEMTNLNMIYNRLIRNMHRRDWEKRQLRCIQGMEEDDYFLALEAIATAAWHGAGRTATVKEISDHCDESEFTVQWNAFREGAKQGAANLLTTFYFKQVEARHDGEQPFEFTHKSFCEYLIVRRMVRLLDYMQEFFEEQKRQPNRKKWPEKSALECWYRLCSSTPMDLDLYHFLWDEIALNSKEIVLEWQEMICKLISYVVANGFPPVESRPEFKEEDRLSRNAEEALLAAHSACALVTKKVVRINWGDEITAGAWLTRLRGQRIGPNIFLYKCFNHLDLHECVLDVNDFYHANLSFANLEHAQMNFAMLYGADLGGACLGQAQLEEATLHWTNLKRAKLREVHLGKADLRRANLEGADLRGANLREANLRGANLEGADLRGADLRGADLRGVNLEGVNLENTILDDSIQAVARRRKMF